MKRILFLALLGSPGMAKAQSIAAGTVAVGGGLGYNSTQTTYVTTGTNPYTSKYRLSTFRLNTTGTYFVADNLALGLSVAHVATGGKNTTTLASSVPSTQLIDPPYSWQWRVGGVAQYYKMFTEQFGIIGSLGAGYENDATQTLRYINTPNGPYPVFSQQTSKGYYANLTPAIVFFPVPKLGLTASAGSLEYSHLNHGATASNQTASTSDFGAGFGLDQLQFGGTFYFGR